MSERTAPPALAHSDVVATSPRDGAVRAQPPQRVVVTYGEVIGAVTSARVVSGGRDIAADRALPLGRNATIREPTRGTRMSAVNI